ncbi:MAG: glycosyltransferase family 2 protein, partial [Deltaproteobacteria bacterium]
MSGPLVSIVIDNYNYARFLPHCIETALAQTWPHTEVLVVDDASTDGSQEIIARYPAAIPVLRAVNGGQAAALNAGFLRSRGSIVIFLDSDDSLEPHAVERIVHGWRPGVAKIQYRLTITGAGADGLDLFPHRDIPFDSGDVVPLLLRSGRYSTAVTSGNAFDR